MLTLQLLQCQEVCVCGSSGAAGVVSGLWGVRHPEGSKCWLMISQQSAREYFVLTSLTGSSSAF